MPRIHKLSTWTLFALVFAFPAVAFAQTAAPIPTIIEKDGRHALIVDGKPFFMFGGQVHNSSAWPAMMPAVWRAARAMYLNTLEIPLYWEQIEPEQGKFNFSMVDLLLQQARMEKVRLVLLWFGTWKNGSSHYMPGWMKNQPEKYPNVTGNKDRHVDSPTPFSTDAMHADMNAFAAVMNHLKKADPQRTVIMVQVENEPGTWDSMRDYSPGAEKYFKENVPPALMKPAVLQALHAKQTSTGTWKEVFGDRADEYFNAWYIASYIEKVASAGKATYPLPLYVNVALRDPLTDPMANTYESGGATDNVIPLWKVAAPSINLLAPDIYLDGSERDLKVLDLYNRPDNTLFVPEAALAAEKAKYLYEALTRGGIGFSPFGIDDNGNDWSDEKLREHLKPFAQEYQALLPAMPQLAKWAFEGKLHSAVEHDDRAAQTINLGNWQAEITFGTGDRGPENRNSQPTGKILIAKLDANNFIVVGDACHITFKPMGANAGRAWQYNKVEEGYFDKDGFKFKRILNGDETDFGGPRLGVKPEIMRIGLVAR